MARPRKKGKKDLPLNLYEFNGYFSYRHPDNGKYIGLGKNKEESIIAAQEANILLIKNGNLVNKITGTDKSFSEFLDCFLEEKLPERGLKDKTIQDYKNKIAVIKKESFAKKAPHEIEVSDVSDFLKKSPPTQSNRYRSLLVLAFRYAIAEGLTKENPADVTMPRMEEVKRKRLTIEGYNAIWNYANEVLRNAMDLALQTIQRREDIADAKFSDIKDGFLWVQQKKTGMPIKIAITPPLKEVLNKCRDNVVSPYIIHQGFKTNKNRRGKKMAPNGLTQSFGRARLKSRYYDALLPEERPSFHEIRALGADLYRKAGWKESEIQKLLGHTSEKMTKIYLERHELTWIEANCGIDLKKLSNPDNS